MMMNLCSSNGSSNGLGLSLIRGREERKPMVVALCVEMWGTRKHSPFTSLEPRVLVDMSFASASELLPEYYTSRWLGACRRSSHSSLRHTTRTTTTTTTVEALALESERARKRASVREAANVALNVRTPTHHSASPLKRDPTGEVGGLRSTASIPWQR